MKLLIDEPPLQILPSLAVLIGLNEAIALQQLHYWIINKNRKGERTAHLIEGHWWVYNSYDGWQKDFPFWSTTTIKRAFLSLEKLKLVISRQFEQAEREMRKWYTINYDELERLNGGANQIGPIWPDAPDQPGPMDQANSALSNGSERPDGADQNEPMFMHETTSETTTENTHTQVAAPAAREGGRNQSRHSFSLLLEWARSQRNVESPQAVATARCKDGLADDLVDEWQRERAECETIASARGSVSLPAGFTRDDAMLARLLSSVEPKVNVGAYASWFQPIQGLVVNAGVKRLGLLVRDRVSADWISGNYADVLEEAEAELGLAGYVVEFFYAA